MMYHGYTIDKEHDHVIVRGPSGEWREDTTTDAIREINRIRGVPIERYQHAQPRQRDEENTFYTRKEIQEYNGMD